MTKREIEQGQRIIDELTRRASRASELLLKLPDSQDRLAGWELVNVVSRFNMWLQDSLRLEARSGSAKNS
jgi:hypothetical protein